MDYNRAKDALVEICDDEGIGDENKVKMILDEHPTLINEVIIIAYLLLYDNSISSDILEFGF